MTALLMEVYPFSEAVVDAVRRGAVLIRPWSTEHARGGPRFFTYVA